MDDTGVSRRLTNADADGETLRCGMVWKGPAAGVITKNNEPATTHANQATITEENVVRDV